MILQIIINDDNSINLIIPSFIFACEILWI